MPPMDSSVFTPLQPARIDWQADTPVATDFDDPYFSRDDGPAESRYVFIDANQLPDLFDRLSPQPGSRFCIGETGFGTGLNFLCAAQCWLERAPQNACLHYLSTELFPLTAEALSKAHQGWPEFAALSRELRLHYPAATPGFHRIQLCQGRIVLTLLLGDASDMLARLIAPASGLVDCWFLDGFAPARNPRMWTPALFQHIARLSKPEARFATFTAAGAVRRGLQQAGFDVQKYPGYGRKRDMLVGHYPGTQDGAVTLPADQASPGSRPDVVPLPADSTPGRVLVCGAGLAGATTARALAERGWHVNVIDAQGIATGASGNLAGVVYTTPSAHPTAQNRFYQSSYFYSLHWFRRYGFPRTPEQGRFAGVLQKAINDKQQHKLTQAAASGCWPETVFSVQADGFLLPQAGYIAPVAWCHFLLDHPNITVTQGRVTEVIPASGQHGAHLHLVSAQQQADTVHAEAIVLACTFDAPVLANADWLTLKRIRGQVTYCSATPASRPWRQALCHSGYLSPEVNGLHCVGATFDLHDQSPEPRDADNTHNLNELKQQLPEHWQQLGGEAIHIAGERVGYRCQSTDFLPVVGPAVRVDHTTADGFTPLPGVYLNIAHGSRGITGTPLCAELIASELCQEPLPVDDIMRQALSPARFLQRARSKRRKPHRSG